VRLFFVALALVASAVVWLFAGWAMATWARLAVAADAMTWLTLLVQGGMSLAAAVCAAVFAMAAWPEGDPLRDAHWCELLFREHPRHRLAAWATTLRHFRFVRGSGGGMDDHGDALMIALDVPSLAEVGAVLATIGATAEPMYREPDDSPHGESASIQIGNARLTGYRYRGRLELSLSDSDEPWSVTQRTIDLAQSIEAAFDSVRQRLIEPPVDSRYCVCPRYYPSFWRAASRR
jgi:hypothetical protein